jgi:two-component system chemotaxis response regulator CheB
MPLRDPCGASVERGICFLADPAQSETKLDWRRTDMAFTRRDIVVIGASAGGVRALCRLAADLPAEFPAAMLVVQHIGPNRSVLPELLTSAGPNTAQHARNGERIRQGHFAVAPSDHHLLVLGEAIRLTRGPKENFSRPAIDTLFRSAASEHGPRVIGVVLTGNLCDGTAGLQAIKRHGGLAVVQDPLTAFAPSMPANALGQGPIDYCLPLERIGQKLFELVQRQARWKRLRCH